MGPLAGARPGPPRGAAGMAPLVVWAWVRRSGGTVWLAEANGARGSLVEGGGFVGSGGPAAGPGAGGGGARRRRGRRGGEGEQEREREREHERGGDGGAGRGGEP